MGHYDEYYDIDREQQKEESRKALIERIKKLNDADDIEFLHEIISEKEHWKWLCGKLNTRRRYY